jgi:hypothetical protein
MVAVKTPQDRMPASVSQDSPLLWIMLSVWTWTNARRLACVRMENVLTWMAHTNVFVTLDTNLVQTRRNVLVNKIQYSSIPYLNKFRNKKLM